MNIFFKQHLSHEDYLAFSRALDSREICIVPIQALISTEEISKKNIVLALLEEFSIYSHAKTLSVSALDLENNPFNVPYPSVTSFLLLNFDGPYTLETSEEKILIEQGKMLYTSSKEGLKIIPSKADQRFLLSEMIQTESERLVLYLIKNLHRISFSKNLKEPVVPNDIEGLFENTKESLIEWISSPENIKAFREKTIVEIMRGMKA